MISYGRQSIGEEEIEAVVEVMRSDFLTQGSTVPQFEQALANYCGASYAVAVSNGTAALHLACLAAGLQAGDYLWTSALTFVASANCGRYCGAEIDLVDIDPVSRNMDMAALAAKLAQAELSGCLPKVLVAVHFAGLPCDLEALAELAKRYDFVVIEDAAHSMGSRYQQTVIGSCDFSDLTIFSFHPVKTMTTGEGGMITCNDPLLAKQLLALRNHGIVREEAEWEKSGQGRWYYEQQQLGFNYRMTDIQAAIGLVQLKRLPTFITRRQQLVDRYNELLTALPLTLPATPNSSVIAWHLYAVELEVDGVQRSLIDQLAAGGVRVGVHFIPVHLQPYYQRRGFVEGDYPAAEKYYKRTLSLPLYPELTETEQDCVVECLAEVLS